ncbi:HutD family protein [Roseovarius sp. SCSIO 43702]|uniref:HutD/Ves family protein n=1 Tax=Roseovarius sp. SCSIO 43702 TaxID=2823043 RepID=UPI001C72B256|nr:HutD family protein [Roseovarius sp. SCSIO 43702]QYX56221.1 HutD family protein [Roseovarius sp. SCSIO 43702]
MHVLNGADLVEVPWKNGGGVTRNIAEGRIGEQGTWRLSRADVAEDGPFSNFAGLRRILTVVSGAGMDLVHPGGALRAAPFAPVAFGGGLAVTARLWDGPLTDLNLMFDPALCDGTVELRRGRETRRTTPPDHGLTALHVLSGQPRIDEASFVIADTIFLTTPVMVTLQDGDALLEITLRSLSPSAHMRLCIVGR